MSGRPVARTFDQRLAVISKWGEILLRNVVPICEKDNRGHTQGHGTGLLVQRGEANFLVTAAHVLDPLRDQRRLFFPCAQSGERKIVGRILSTETPVGKSRKEDLVDIAVVKLDGESQPPYPEIQKESLEFSCLRPSVLPRSGKSLFVTGFPATRTKSPSA